jgi:F-type H+-transporting ATPase subunit a
MTIKSIATSALFLLALLAAPARAQEGAEKAAPAAEAGPAPDLITPHITDSHHLELFGSEIQLPRWAPLHVAGVTLDMSPTKHVVMLLIAALLSLGTLLFAAFVGGRQTERVGHLHGFAGVMETLVLYVRNEVALPNVGPHGEAFVPFICTLFFFILFANLLGLIPYGATATGNIAVTATLALVTFVVIEGATMAALGKDYIWTVVYRPPDMPLPIKIFMVPIMTVIEIASKLTKPFALAIRLFANMTAGHIVLLAIISLIFTFNSWIIVGGPVVMGIGISMLELFVAFLQAFIFALLASVFIGLGRQAAH